MNVHISIITEQTEMVIRYKYIYVCSENFGEIVTKITTKKKSPKKWSNLAKTNRIQREQDEDKR